MADRRKPSSWFAYLCAVLGALNAAYAGGRLLISYRVLELGGDTAAISVVTALYSLMPLLAVIPAGRAVDGKHAGTTLRLGAAVTVAAFALTAVEDDLVLLTMGSTLLGFGQMLTTVAGQGYIAAMSPPADYDRRFGGFALAISIGQAVGLPLAGAVAAAHLPPGPPTTAPLWIMSFLAGVATAITLSGHLRIQPSRPDRRHTPVEGVRGMILTPGMRPAIFSSLIVLASIDMMTAYLPAFGEQHGFPVLVITLILTARSVSSAVSRLFLVGLLRTLPRRGLLIAATLGPAIPVALIPVVPHPLALGLIMILAGFFWGIGQPLTMTSIATLVGPSSRASALSLRLTGNRLGQVLIPLAAGAASSVAGSASVFLLTGALLAGAGASTWRALHGKSPA